MDSNDAKTNARVSRVLGNLRDEMVVVEDLRTLGVHVEHLRDLAGASLSGAVVTRLALWLRNIDNADVQSQVVRLLTGPWGSKASHALLDVFELRARDDEVGVGWTIANALSVCADVSDKNVKTRIVDLVRDARYGRAREMLVPALGRWKGDQMVTGVVKELLQDRQLAGHALQTALKLKVDVGPEAEALLQDSRSWVRRLARKVVANK